MENRIVTPGNVKGEKEFSALVRRFNRRGSRTVTLDYVTDDLWRYHVVITDTDGGKSRLVFPSCRSFRQFMTGHAPEEYFRE